MQRTDKIDTLKGVGPKKAQNFAKDALVFGKYSQDVIREIHIRKIHR